MSKNNITVFRKERFFAASEVWRCGYEIEVGNSYNSLELHFTTILSLIQSVGKDQNQSDIQISMETRKCTEKWISFNVWCPDPGMPKHGRLSVFILFFNLGRMCHLLGHFVLDRVLHCVCRPWIHVRNYILKHFANTFQWQLIWVRTTLLYSEKNGSLQPVRFGGVVMR